MTNKVHIDGPAGVIDIEGEKDFVEGLLAKLFPLVEGAGFGSRLPNSNPVRIAETNEPLQAEETPLEQNDKNKAKRRRVNTPPKGQSCPARILTLKQEGFFKDHRSTGDIVEGLKSKGWTHVLNQVSAALASMFERGDIQRTKEGNSSWKYYWDRD